VPAALLDAAAGATEVTLRNDPNHAGIVKDHEVTNAVAPHLGPDQICQIKVVLSGLPSVVVEERDSALQRAIDRAMNGAALAVRRSVQRRRLKPRRRRSSQAPTGPAS
jgi:hypothetical protein